ncbi:MAG: glycosyltransferase 87 family protein [Acidobacteriota bacterium]
MVLRNAFDSWRRTPWFIHALVVGGLLIVLVARFHASVLSSVPVEDEVVYIEAFERAGDGVSPFTGLYYYTTTFALVGGVALDSLGTVPVLAILRGTNLVGMAVLAWISAAWLPWRISRRFWGAAVYVAIAPAVRLGAQWGNLSLVVLGLLVVGLLAWRRRPVLSGLLLGLSLVIKPLGPVAVGALLVHRPVPHGWRQVIAASIALAGAMLLILPMPWLGEWLSFGGRPANGRNMSMHHLLWCFGVHVGTLPIAIGVAMATTLAARLRAWDRETFLGFAGVVGVMALPLVWSHTLLFVLPLQVMALTLAFTPRARSELARRYEAPLVVVGCLAIQLCEGLGGIETWPPSIQGIIALPVILAPLALLIYVVRCRESASP